MKGFVLLVDKVTVFHHSNRRVRHTVTKCPRPYLSKENVFRTWYLNLLTSGEDLRHMARARSRKKDENPHGVSL